MSAARPLHSSSRFCDGKGRYEPWVFGCQAVSVACRNLYGAETRSASRCPLVFVNEPAQPVASFHECWWRISTTLNRWRAIWRRELQAAMRTMPVVMLDEHRQGSLEMVDTANQQPHLSHQLKLGSARWPSRSNRANRSCRCSGRSTNRTESWVGDGKRRSHRRRRSLDAHRRSYEVNRTSRTSGFALNAIVRSTMSISNPAKSIKALTNGGKA
jgi:hypothetical protein